MIAGDQVRVQTFVAVPILRDLGMWWRGLLTSLRERAEDRVCL